MNILLTDDEREAFVGDLERAARHLAEDVENEDAQGMASDLFNIARVLKTGSVEETERNRLWDTFMAQGGRGVELADEIDRLSDVIESGSADLARDMERGK